MPHGSHAAPSPQDPAEPIELGLLPNNAGFIKDGVEYAIGDFMYLHPQVRVRRARAAAAAAVTAS